MRKRGGQMGNNNARKHGFYSKTFKAKENALLSSHSIENFDSEIKLLRILINRTMDKIGDGNNLTLEENLLALRTVSFATAVIERLHRSGHISFYQNDGEGKIE